MPPDKRTHTHTYTNARPTRIYAHVCCIHIHWSMYYWLYLIQFYRSNVSNMTEIIILKYTENCSGTNIMYIVRVVQAENSKAEFQHFRNDKYSINTNQFIIILCIFIDINVNINIVLSMSWRGAFVVLYLKKGKRLTNVM